METGICLFLDWENEIWVTGARNERHKNGNGKTQIPLQRLPYSWSFQNEITLRTATEQF